MLPGDIGPESSSFRPVELSQSRVREFLKKLFELLLVFDCVLVSRQ